MTDPENESKEINRVRIASRQAPLKETRQAPLKTEPIEQQPSTSDQSKKTNVKN